MFQRIRKQINPAMILAFAALVFALTGGAFAATGGTGNGSGRNSNKSNLASSHTLVATISKAKPKAKAGPRGPAGPAGKNGANGASGPAGPTGATGPGGAQGPGGAPGSRRAPQGPAGTAGRQRHNGKNGTFGDEPLPAGKSLTGEWTISGYGTGTRSAHRTAVTFAAPLSEAPAVHYINANFKWNTRKTGEQKSTVCLGNVEKPEAAPGNLCVYATYERV